MSSFACVTVATGIATGIIAGVAVIIVNQIAVLGDGNRQFLVVSSGDGNDIVVLGESGVTERNQAIGNCNRILIVVRYITRGVRS